MWSINFHFSSMTVLTRGSCGFMSWGSLWHMTFLSHMVCKMTWQRNSPTLEKQPCLSISCPLGSASYLPLLRLLQWRQSNSLYNWLSCQYITELAEPHWFCCSVPSSNQAHNPERKMTDIPEEGNGTLVTRELFCSIILQYGWIAGIFFIS